MPPDPFAICQFFPLRPETKNAYSSLRLWGEHLAPGETVRAAIMLRSSTVLLTDRRVLELTPHMDDFGFWNVRSFEGYEESLDLPTATTALVSVQELDQGCRIGLRGSRGEGTLVLEPWRNLGPDHIDRFVGLLRSALAPAADATAEVHPGPTKA